MRHIFGSRIVLSLFSFCFACGLQASALAQNEAGVADDAINEIVVDGTRLGQLAGETGTSISIIDSDELQALGFHFALDALAAASGVTVTQNGPFGGLANVRIRGAASEQTLVLVDGVPVNDASSAGGGFNFGRLDTGPIDRIEILKGPQSSLWGSDAIGGVVSIVTRAPEAGTNGGVYADFGSFATRHGGASFGHSGNRGDFRIDATAISSDGISKADAANGNNENDGYEANTVSAKGGINFDGGARLQANLLRTAAEAEFDSYRFGVQGSIADGDERSETEESVGNVSLSLPALNGRLDHHFLAGYSVIDRENFSAGASSYRAEGRRSVYRYQGTAAFGDRNTLAFGAEREQTETLVDEIAIDSVFAVHEFKPAANLVLTGGLRADRHERFGSETTARLGAAYQLNPNLTLRASWGDGFKAPTLFQTTFFCCGASTHNPDLKPESSSALDAGIEWRASDGGAEFGFTAYNQFTENLISFSFAGGGYENIAEVDSAGVEVTAGIALGAALRLDASYAFIDASDGDGEPLIQIPRHSGDLGLSYDAGGDWSGRLLLRHNGSEPSFGGGGVADWTRVDLTARYRRSERVVWYLRLENLLDEHYQQILGYGVPGRSGSIGVRLEY